MSLRLVLLVVVYFGGCYVANGAVADGCTHGNCVHGWYSHDTGAEKLLALAWMLGFPLVAWRLLPGEGANPDPWLLPPVHVLKQYTPPPHQWARDAVLQAKARRSWCCMQCSGQIQAGETYHYFVLGHGKRTRRIRVCAPCRQAAGAETRPREGS